MEPAFGHGKICYLEIPARDIDFSAKFFSEVFGWKVKTRDDGSVSFDDGVGQVSGMWVIDREPMAPGLVVHIMVDDAEATLYTLQQSGGEIIQGIGAHHPEITALFRDPGGNVFGIYQHRG